MHPPPGRRPTTFLALGIALAISMTGCTGNQTPTPTETPHAVTTTTSSSPTAASTPTSTDSIEPACSPLRDQSKPKISGESQQIAVDHGPRNGATGDALLDPSGIPVAYIVAPDDIPDFIADRFCMGLAYLNNINGPRRGGAMDLYAGDTINLDAETVTTVGDINGEVMNFSLPDPLPPQHQPKF